MQLRAIERKKVSDEIVEQIKEMIADGVWKPSDKLPSENDLRDMFQVSRVSVREALKQLVSSNIIETRQGSGSFVREFDGAFVFDSSLMTMYVHSMDDCTIRDMMEFRAMIEVESVKLATERATPTDLSHLQSIYDHMVASSDDIHLFSDYDLEFHKFIAQITRNTVLIKCYAVVWDFLKEYFNKVVEKIGVAKGTYYHGAILEAMKEKNKHQARALMKEHLDVTNQGFFDHTI